MYHTQSELSLEITRSANNLLFYVRPKLYYCAAEPSCPESSFKALSISEAKAANS
jgi:hypothetical protein